MRHSTSFTNNDIDWLATTFTQAQKAQDGVCRNLVVGMRTQIVYADIGSLQQPQAKILGVLVTYQTDMVKFQVRQTWLRLASCLLIFLYRWAPNPEQTQSQNVAVMLEICLTYQKYVHFNLSRRSYVPMTTLAHLNSRLCLLVIACFVSENLDVIGIDCYLSLLFRFKLTWLIQEYTLSCQLEEN